MRDLTFLLLLSILFSLSKNSFIFNNQSIRGLEEDKQEMSDLIMKLFSIAFEDCYDELVSLETKKDRGLIKFGVILNYIGKGSNDLGDEIECRQSIKKTKYLIADLKKSNLIIGEQRLADFLNITSFSLGACVTDKCEEPFFSILNLLLDFQNSTDNIGHKNHSGAFYEHEDIPKNNIIYIFIVIIGFYSLFKVIFGIVRLIYIPKGYDNQVAKILREQNRMSQITQIINVDENEILASPKNDISIDSGQKDNNTNIDLNEHYPLYLKILRFLDFFNDVKLLSTYKNRYFNDRGLESINLSRTIVLYFILFYSTFTSLFDLPSRDMLNQSFFSSKMIFIFRLSTNSIIFWIFLEGAYTSFKLMAFINSQMNEYYKKEKTNKNKGFYIKLIIIYGKFIVLFIPKILTFLLCYFVFYINALKFEPFFNAKTTYEFIIEERMFKNIKCNNDNPFDIFFNFFSFSNNISFKKECYDFTYIYINILFCTLVFMVLLFIIFVFQKAFIEIFFIILNIALFFGLIFVVNDERIIDPNEDPDNLRYNFYHFRGQTYLHKIAYLSLGVYHFGFILGILCFNQNNIKTEERKSIDNNNNISYKLPYYPLSFLNKYLIWFNKIRPKIRYFIILVCFAIMILISLLYQFSKDKITEKINEKEIKDEDDKNENIELVQRFNQNLKYYFYFERHLLLILFFFINFIMITLPIKGFYKKLTKFKLTVAISRTGFTIVCLYYIFGFFYFCAFLIKLKFNFYTFFIMSIGNFLIIFFFCFIVNIVFELPLRKLIKKIIRKEFCKGKKDNNIII